MKIYIYIFRFLDQYLSELSTSVEIDLMPSINDLSSFSLPQQPINRYFVIKFGCFIIFSLIIPYASAFNTCSRVTNPHDFTIRDVSLIGSCGQNINDFMMYNIL